MIFSIYMNFRKSWILNISMDVKQKVKISMTIWEAPKGGILNIIWDIEQNGDFRGARGEGVFFCGRCPGTPHHPRVRPSRTRGLFINASLRDASLSLSLRFAFASLCFRFAFASLCFRFASNLKSETNCEMIRFRKTTRRIRVPTRRRVGGYSYINIYIYILS